MDIIIMYNPFTTQPQYKSACSNTMLEQNISDETKTSRITELNQNQDIKRVLYYN